jgi:hypothetical protein
MIPIELINKINMYMSHPSATIMNERIKKYNGYKIIANIPDIAGRFFNLHKKSKSFCKWYLHYFNTKYRHVYYSMYNWHPLMHVINESPKYVSLFYSSDRFYKKY